MTDIRVEGTLWVGGEVEVRGVELDFLTNDEAQRELASAVLQPFWGSKI